MRILRISGIYKVDSIGSELYAYRYLLEPELDKWKFFKRMAAQAAIIADIKGHIKYKMQYTKYSAEKMKMIEMWFEDDQVSWGGRICAHYRLTHGPTELDIITGQVIDVTPS